MASVSYSVTRSCCVFPPAYQFIVILFCHLLADLPNIFSLPFGISGFFPKISHYCIWMRRGDVGDDGTFPPCPPCPARRPIVICRSLISLRFVYLSIVNCVVSLKNSDTNLHLLANFSSVQLSSKTKENVRFRCDFKNVTALK